MVCPVFGNYPKEYNRAVHGPYYPWVNYVKSKDKPLQEVKLGEFKEWFGRRNKTPQAAIAAISRTFLGYQCRWMATRYGSPLPGYLHVLIGFSVAHFFMMIPYLRTHRQHKYHW